MGNISRNATQPKDLVDSAKVCKKQTRKVLTVSHVLLHLVSWNPLSSDRRDEEGFLWRGCLRLLGCNGRREGGREGGRERGREGEREESIEKWKEERRYEERRW